MTITNEEEAVGKVNTRARRTTSAASIASNSFAPALSFGLVTPMAIMVGTGRVAQAGVLIKNAEAIERLKDVDTVIGDKTGTLTEGKPKLTQVVAAASFSSKKCSGWPPG